MPIIGLTDQAARFPQIGQLRKGAPKPEKGNRPGADLQYFRFDSQDEAVAAAFAKAYGNEPAAINVFLPFATPEQNFSAWQEEYVASGLVHRCDGETMTQWLTPQNTYSFERRPCPYHTGDKKRTSSNPGCKPTGRLMVIIPELKRLAYVMVGTTSIHDIMELSANLDAAFAFRGDLTGIPFVLRRMPRMISTPSGKDGGKARHEKWLLFLEPAPEWVGMQLEAMRYSALPSASPLSLPAPDRVIIDAETGEIVDDDDDDVIDAEPVEEIETEEEDVIVFSDDELVIFEASPKDFYAECARLIPRYEDAGHAIGGMKKANGGKASLPADPHERLNMYRILQAHAEDRDAEEAPDAELLAAAKQNADSIHAEEAENV